MSQPPAPIGTRPASRAGALLARVLCLLLLTVPGWAETPAPGGAEPPGDPAPGADLEPAVLRVRGYGFFGNLRLKQNLRALRPETGWPPVVDALTIEDAALLLLAAVQQEGYLRARLSVEIEGPDGTPATFEGSQDQPLELTRGTQAREVTFRIRRGELHHYRSIRFEGLAALPESQAVTWFLVPDLVVPQKGGKVYTPQRLDRGLRSLREELRRRGYAEAAAEVAGLEVDPATGRVEVRVRVAENRRYWVTSVETTFQDSDAALPTRVERSEIREPYSDYWRQERIRTLKNAQFESGYPDARVEVETSVVSETPDAVALRAVARVVRGPLIRVGRLSFEGLDRTRESLLRRRVRFGEGEPLDRLAVEEARFQMLRLGVFDRAEAVLLPLEDQPGKREVRYVLEESKPVELSVLAGYGSYELLRGGLELEQLNLFGLAHRHRLLLAQSFKATRVEYNYAVPQAFSPLGELSGTGFFRQREETTFTRREYGAGLGYQRLLPTLPGEITTRLLYEQLSTRDDRFNPDYGLQDAAASSLGATFEINRTDNPLDPQAGHRLYATAEVATELLGGDANYQRLECGGSLHFGLSRTLRVHAGVSHAVLLTPGDVATDLPFNKRFFLGGASTVRGFVQGEAASRDDTGKLVGDESYLLGQFELEQRLTLRWSVVGFVDAAGLARDLADYPGDEVLVSAGAGIRWRTPIGPVRLEYGWNLNPRERDPSGTLQFSVGYPF